MSQGYTRGSCGCQPPTVAKLLAAAKPDTLAAMPLSRILAVKLADIGDVLLTTPALRALRARYPTARLEYLTTANGAQALRDSTLVDEVLRFEKGGYDRLGDTARLAAVRRLSDFALSLRVRGYDAVVLFHHFTTRRGALKLNALLTTTAAPRRVGLDNGRGWALTERVTDAGFGAQHEAEYALQLAMRLDAPPIDLALDFPISANAHAAAAHLLAPLAEGPRVALFPGSGQYSTARRWPPQAFAAVADALQERGVRVILVGRDSDQTGDVVRAMRGSPDLDLTNQGDLATLGAALARMDVVLTNDGGPMHIAAAVGTPVVSVFGPSNAEAYGPWDAGQPPQEWPPRSNAPPSMSRHTLVRLGLGCQPCFYRGHHLGAPQGCATRECLGLLPPRLALEATLHRLGQAQKIGHPTRMPYA